MAEFTQGDRVKWKSHGGEAVGTVERKITEATEAGGRKVKASKDEPQYLVKAINDHHGHPIGDEVLRSVGAAIKRTRLSDEVFRVGGDEFAILLPACRRLDAEVALARLLAAIDVCPIVDLEPSFGVIYGIASAVGGDAAVLHAAADRELVGAKRRLYTERAMRSARRGLLGAAA
jgi:predicted signal transduction protein with EAL and GGDEF domain